MSFTSMAELMNSRRSVRAFTSQPIPQAIIKKILSVASSAPSGSNTQPWKVYVVTGTVRESIVEAVCKCYDELVMHPDRASAFQPGYDYYPNEWFSPYKERRRENGWGLYGLLGIQKGDKAKMIAQHKKNFTFFDAPVGIFLTMDRGLGTGSKMDIAMFIQNILLAAKAAGLDTCAQAAWNEYQSIVLPLVGASEKEILICTVAMGYADSNAQVNQFAPGRLAVEEFSTWLGFE
ncbi:MAG: nitroreductase [Neisseriaceae bacterium]